MAYGFEGTQYVSFAAGGAIFMAFGLLEAER